MSNLLTEINRMRSLMGLTSVLIVENTNPIAELQAVVKKFFSLTDDEAAKYFNQLTEQEKIYLKSLVSSSDNVFGDLSTAAGVASLRKFMKESSNESLKKIFSKAQILITKKLASLDVQKLITTDLSVSSILKNRPTTVKINNKQTNLVDILTKIENEGGVKNSKLFDGQPEMWAILADDIDNVIDSVPDNVKTYLGDVQSDILERLNPEDYVEAIQKQENDLVTQISNETIDDIKKVVDVEDVSSKLKKMVDSDQTMRQGEDFDVNIDINNQTELKKMMGEDPNGFINKLNSFEDLNNFWLIAQHSDNDLNLQKQILDILKKDQQTIETKFPSNSKEIKSGVAMLEDRVMVNSNTSVVGYRDNDMGNFGDLINGKQIYGSQGGLTEEGYWIPRPIELDGKIYFFETPQKLLKDTDFLNKLNTKRSEMGLLPMEDYLKNMNDMNGKKITIEKNINIIDAKNEEKIIEKLQDKNYQSKVIKIFDKMFYFLSDNQKKYLDVINDIEKSNLEKFKNALIERFGVDGKTEITVTAKDWMDIVKNGKTKSGQPIKMTIEEFEKELDNYYLFVTKENEWSPLNKLNTNYRSNSKEFMNLVKTLYSEDEVSKIIKKGLDQKDFDNIIKDIETKITNKDQNLKMYLNNWVNDNPTDTEGFLKDILLNSKSGKDAESLAENFADSFSLNVASATEGSPYDILLNLDGIRRLSKDTPFGKTGELKTIQVKKVQSINETNTGKIYVTTFGDMRIPKQDQIDILILVDPQGKKLAIGKQIPYENPEGKVSFPEAKKNIFGKKGFYVDTTTPKLLDNSLSDDLFNKKINNKKSIQYIRKNFTLTPDQDKTLKSLGY